MILVRIEKKGWTKRYSYRVQFVWVSRSWRKFSYRKSGT